MSPIRSAAAVVLTLLVTLGVLTVPASAAPERDLSPQISLRGAKLLACKEPTANGRFWRVFVRLDNTRNPEERARSGQLQISRRRQQLATFATRDVPGGATSRTGRLVVPRGGRLIVQASIVADDGDSAIAAGVLSSLSDLSPC